MTLEAEDLEKIHRLIGEKLQRQLSEPVYTNVRYELEIRERIVRVEDELRHQRELMQQGFAQVEKRIEKMDKRFEQVDKRLEKMDKRFEQVAKRFDDQHREIMAIHQEIKRQMRWHFGIAIAIAGVILAALRL